MNNNEMISVRFKREDRYIVIKRSDLANVPVNYRSALVDPLFNLLAHLPDRECLVIESDWPEYKPTWAAIEARVPGEPTEQHQGEPLPEIDLTPQRLAHAEYIISQLNGEVERLREGISKHWKVVCDQRAELDTLRAQLAERGALLRACFTAMLKGGYSKPLRERIKAALSASAEPDSDLCAEGAHEFVPFQSNCVKCSEPYQSAPAPKITPGALMLAMENLAVKALAADHPPVFLPALARQVPLVMLGGVCLRVSYSGLKWYHDQLIEDRWEPLSVDEFEALLTDALRGSQGTNR